MDEEFLALMKQRGTIYAPTLLVGWNWGRAIVAAVTGAVPEYEDSLGCVDERTAEKLSVASELQDLVSDEGITPEMIAAGREREVVRREIMAANLRRIHEKGIPVALATDAGNPLTLHGAAVHPELAAMEAAGIPPDELLVMATRNGAAALRRPDLGTLEAGQVADILVLSQDPRESAAAFRALEAVIHRGVWSTAGSPRPGTADVRRGRR